MAARPPNPDEDSYEFDPYPRRALRVILAWYGALILAAIVFRVVLEVAR